MSWALKDQLIFKAKNYYRKDRFNNTVFLSLSLCKKRSILSGRGNSTNAVFKRTPSQTWPRHFENNK